jgi:hypothetical protein
MVFGALAACFALHTLRTRKMVRERSLENKRVRDHLHRHLRNWYANCPAAQNKTEHESFWPHNRRPGKPISGGGLRLLHCGIACFP